MEISKPPEKYRKTVDMWGGKTRLWKFPSTEESLSRTIFFPIISWEGDHTFLVNQLHSYRFQGFQRSALRSLSLLFSTFSCFSFSRQGEKNMMLRLKAKIWSFSGDSYKIVDANDSSKAWWIMVAGERDPCWVLAWCSCHAVSLREVFLWTRWLHVVA